jgi:replication factor C subunit 2/4
MANFFDNKARALAAASSSKAPKANEVVNTAPRAQPWVEKYRPKSLEEVRSQDHVTLTLKKMVNASNLPHLLLYGPPGSGKTSTIVALCRMLFGPELFSSRVLELNASDDRSITVVRERVKAFAAQHLVNAPTSKEYREQYPCPPCKFTDICNYLSGARGFSEALCCKILLPLCFCQFQLWSKETLC